MGNKLYSTAMKDSIKLRERFPELTQEQSERISLWYATGRLIETYTEENVTDLSLESEEAFAWMNERWVDLSEEGGRE